MGEICCGFTVRNVFRLLHDYHILWWAVENKKSFGHRIHNPDVQQGGWKYVGHVLSQLTIQGGEEEAKCQLDSAGTFITNPHSSNKVCQLCNVGLESFIIYF